MQFHKSSIIFIYTKSIKSSFGLPMSNKPLNSNLIFVITSPLSNNPTLFKNNYIKICNKFLLYNYHEIHFIHPLGLFSNRYTQIYQNNAMHFLPDQNRS